MRKPIIAGNWKMNKNIKEALEKAKKEKEDSEKEFNEKQEILKADIEKTEKLILEIKE